MDFDIPTAEFVIMELSLIKCLPCKIPLRCLDKTAYKSTQATLFYFSSSIKKFNLSYSSIKTQHFTKIKIKVIIIKNKNYPPSSLQ